MLHFMPQDRFSQDTANEHKGYAYTCIRPILPSFFLTAPNGTLEYLAKLISLAQDFSYRAETQKLKQ